MLSEFTYCYQQMQAAVPCYQDIELALQLSLQKSNLESFIIEYMCVKKIFKNILKK